MRFQIAATPQFGNPQLSGRKKECAQKLLGPDIFQWGGVLPREGVGAKKFGMSLETQGKQIFWRDILGFWLGCPGVVNFSLARFDVNDLEMKKLACLKLPLKTLTSLNKEVRPFFLGENSIWSFPLFLPLAITAFGGPEGYFSLATIAFGAFQFIVPKYYYRLEKMEFKESGVLIQGGYGLQGSGFWSWSACLPESESLHSWN